MKKYDLSKFNILLTGGSSGIGKSIARALVDSGANVGIISRQDPSVWAEDLDLWNSKKNWIKEDFNNYHDIQAAMSTWIDSLPLRRLDILILCAATYGSDGRHGFEGTSLGEWEELMAVNTTAPFVLARCAIENMLPNNSGLMIGITSDVAYRSGPKRVAYSVSKTAMRAMLDGIADELADKSIEVVQLLPGVQFKTEGIMKRRASDFSFDKYANPDIFAKPVLDLITSDKKRNKRYIIDEKGEILPFYS